MAVLRAGSAALLVPATCDDIIICDSGKSRLEAVVAKINIGKTNPSERDFPG
jgi:hypothetical protein